MSFQGKIIILPQLFPKAFIGMAIFPFIFLKDKKLVLDPVLLQHEKIHIQQQKELLFIFFFLWYFFEFLILFIRYRDFRKAYHNICFEKEAYYHEQTAHYLKKRSSFSFLKFL